MRPPRRNSLKACMANMFILAAVADVTDTTATVADVKAAAETTTVTADAVAINMR